MPQLSLQAVNQQIANATGSIQVLGTYGGPPSRLSLDELKIGLADFPISLGHQHNLSRGNTFEALTLRLPNSEQRLLVADWQGPQDPSTASAGRLQRTAIQADKPVGFELSFGQALNSKILEEPVALFLTDRSAMAESILSAAGGAQIAEFEMDVLKGQVEVAVPAQQINVGRKVPFAALKSAGVTQSINAPCKILGVVASGDMQSSFNLRLDPMSQTGAAAPLMRAIVVNSEGEFCGELSGVSNLKGNLLTAAPAQLLLATPTESEVNQKWSEHAQALLAKAGNPPEKRAGVTEDISDTDIESMSDVTKAKLLGLLAGVTEVFHRSNIPYTLACGTELGNARNGDLIKWDDDIDIVVPMEHLGEMLSHRDEFLKMGILITPRYHGVKFSFLDDKQREKDGTPYPFVDIFAVEKNAHGEWEFEDVIGCKEKFPLEQLPPNVFERSTRNVFGPKHLGIEVNTMARETSLLYLNRVYGGDAQWSKDSNILNKAYTHTYDHDTGASKEPRPLNVTEFEPGTTPQALWALKPRVLQKPLLSHPKYLPELMKHLENHQENWRLPTDIKASWPQWIADLPVQK